MAVGKPEEPEKPMEPIDFFQPWESKATGWESARDLIDEINNRSSGQVVWRGLKDSTYALHSSLYRYLFKKLGTLPTEEQMVEAEIKILEVARQQWRFDNLTALETFAQIQHYGGPTRFLDVSFNPLIALWFAVEEKFDSEGKPIEDTDGRLFSFDSAGKGYLQLDGFGSRYDIPWDMQTGFMGFAMGPSSKDEWEKDWQFSQPGVWRPPSYNERIFAQNSAFLVGGVPVLTLESGAHANYIKTPGDGVESGTWNLEEVRRATSVSLPLSSTERVAPRRASPNFTIVISATAKKEIRKKLEKEYGYKASSMYPDFYGLGSYMRKSLRDLDLGG